MRHTDIKLKFPIDINGQTIKAVRMRAPRVADMIATEKIKGTDAEKEVQLFANLCELSPEDIGNLEMADYKQLQKAWASFLG